ncbi:MAG: two-component regulator propeller domain-containing protein [Chitinophagales bacterium]
MKQIVSFLVFSFFLSIIQAQTPVAVGQWKSYLPYGGNISVAVGGDKIYSANATSVYSYDKTDNSYETFSKANGLSDVGAVEVFFGEEQNTLVITYLNSNIDFIVNNSIINFPYIKTSGITGDKSVNQAAFFGDTVLLSCGFGIVVYNIGKNESPATYIFIDEEASSTFEVHACAVYDNAIYAATDFGIFKGNLSETNLQDFGKWENISLEDTSLPDGGVSGIQTLGNKLYAVVDDSLLYVFDGSTWVSYFEDAEGYSIQHLNTGNNMLSVLRTKTEDGNYIIKLTIINNDGSQVYDTDLSDTFFEARQVDIDTDGNSLTPAGSFWVADPYRGLLHYNNGVYSTYIPNGPLSPKVFDMEFFNYGLWVAPGEINASWQYLNNYEGFFVMNYGSWNNVSQYGHPELENVYDLFTVTYDARTNKIYFGSFGDGIVEYDNNNKTIEVFNELNTPALDIAVGDAGSCRVAGIAIDADGNLWASNYGAINQLVVRTAAGEWRNFSCSVSGGLAQIIIDDFGQKWIQSPKGTGVFVYNHGLDVLDDSDDEQRLLTTGAGSGNLATNTIYCLAKDKDGEIWVGTSEGVSIFYNPGEVFSGTTSGDASQPLVNLGGYNEFLLSKEIVNCITIDGANRKWIGTNSGVFLISEDGTEQLLFFNESNSPLLSNSVLTIAIDGETGEVFFGTSKGIVSYRYTATEGTAVHQNVKVFPNPVRENYNGLIAISGLVQDAQVKITDDAGRLIYETTALGGQAVWDGKGYNGQRAKTGVYLVYSSSDDGIQTFVTKFLIVN